jgi:hypothetical protein
MPKININIKKKHIRMKLCEITRGKITLFGRLHQHCILAVLKKSNRTEF